MNQALLKEARFLVVDDEIANVVILRRMLEKYGCSKIEGTTDARETLKLFHAFRPDIILLDLMMPQLDGFQVMEQLKPLITADDYLPILVLTADNTPETKRKALAAGAKDFLTKPFDAVELLLRIFNLIETRFLHLQLRDQNQILEERVAMRTRELMNSQEQLRALAASLNTVREAERTEIAREVHDELGQALTGLKMDVAWLDRRWTAERDAENAPAQSLVREKIRAMSRTLDETVRAVQRISTQLRPSILDDLGLEAAVEWQAQEFAGRTEMVCECVSSLDDLTVPREQATAAFRIVQEALTNVARHAGATSVNILLEENGGYLVVEVQDNGRGITAAQRDDSHSLGVIGMRERALRLGGEFSIMGVAARGTTVLARLPLPGIAPAAVEEWI